MDPLLILLPWSSRNPRFLSRFSQFVSSFCYRLQLPTVPSSNLSRSFFLSFSLCPTDILSPLSNLSTVKNLSFSLIKTQLSSFFFQFFPQPTYSLFFRHLRLLIFSFAVFSSSLAAALFPFLPSILSPAAALFLSLLYGALQP